MRGNLEFYERIRNTIKVSHIVRQRFVLNRKGNEYTGLCPFHDEKTPSFTVNDIKKFYHCFGCGAHGDVIKFLSETNSIAYKDAAIKIASDNGIEIPKISVEQEREYEEADRIYHILKLAADFFQSNLNQQTTEYLKRRGVSKDSINSFSLGFAENKDTLEQFFQKKSVPMSDLLRSGLFGKKENGKIYGIFKNRIMFPIYNIYNKIVGFGGRAFGDSMPKYINSPETLVFKKSEVMYGENVAISQSYKDNYFIIVEGYMDVIALHQAGFKNAVASLGTAVTEKHIQKLWRSADEIIVSLDGDKAGIRASNRLINMVLPNISANKTLSFIEMPYDLDPDDFIKDKGADAFKILTDKRIGMSEMIWKMEFEGKIFKNAESKSSLENKLNGYTSQIQDSSLRYNFSRYFKDMFWNHLVRKNGKKQREVQNSEKLLAPEKYSEIDYMERIICAFFVKFPHIISSIEHEIEFQNDELNELKNWIIELIEEDKNIDAGLISDRIKNSRFSSSFLVSSLSDILFLDYEILNKESVNHEVFFKWLYKKHYLLLLKEECAKMLSSNAYEDQSRSASYLEEIRQVSEEINRLSTNFIDN
jgi:DNA primase